MSEEQNYDNYINISFTLLFPIHAFVTKDCTMENGVVTNAAEHNLQIQSHINYIQAEESDKNVVRIVFMKGFSDAFYILAR